MTVQTLEKQIDPIKPPVDPELTRLIELAPPQPIHNRKMYHAYLRILEICLEALGEGDFKKSVLHALSEYVEIISSLIGEYEKKVFPIPKTTQADVLMFLMEQNGLSQIDLTEELGGQPAVSYVLSGERSLNAGQIERLSKRFHVSPAVFFSGA